MKFNRLIAFSLCIFMFCSCASRDVMSVVTEEGAADIEKSTDTSSVITSLEAATDEVQTVNTTDTEFYETFDADSMDAVGDTSDTMTVETVSEEAVVSQEIAEQSAEEVHASKTEEAPDRAEALEKMESVLDVETGITFVETDYIEDDKETAITALLVNDSLTATVNGYYLDMNSYPQFAEATFIVMKFPSKAIIKMEWDDKIVGQTKRTVYLPVNMSADEDVTPSSALWELQPQESIDCIVHCYK